MKRAELNTLRFAFLQIRQEARLLSSAVGWRLLFRLLPVQVPLFTGALIDGLNGKAATVWGLALHSGDPAEGVRVAGLALVCVALSTGTAAYFSERASARLHQETTSRLRGQVLQAWEFASAGYHRRYGASVLFERTLADTRNIGKFARDTVAEGLAAIARLAYPAVMLLLIDPWMALFPLAATPMHMLLARILQWRQSRFNQGLREGRADLTRSVRENLEGIECVQGLGAQAEFMRRIEMKERDLQEERNCSGVYSSLSLGSVWALAAVALAGSWWMGGSRVVSGEISTGQLVAFAGFVGYLAVPLRRLARLTRTTRRALYGLRRIEQLLVNAADGSPRGCEPLNAAEGALQLHDVSYSVRKRPVLSNVSMAFSAGEFVWLRGPSGAGKSTLLRLLAGFEQPKTGFVSLGGQNLRDCAVEPLRKAIAMVPQHPFVFTGTIAENLRLGSPEATFEEMMTVCAQTGLSTMIRQLRDGLETVVGERGLRLSGGESQKLCIARALLRRPRFLLLDEPLAALDPASEAELLRTLSALGGDVTIIMVAHQVSTLRGIHRVVELDEASVREWPAQHENLDGAVLAHS